MTSEEELKLQGDKVVELLNEITASKQYLIEKNDFGQANMLGRITEMIKCLHIVNVETTKENLALSDSLRLHYAGQAMQGLLSGNEEFIGYPLLTVKQAFSIADNMVKHGKKEGQIKETESEANALEPDSNNNEQ